MSTSSQCNITENYFNRNEISGVNMVDCKENLIYHNIFEENGLQNALDNGDNSWDLGPELGGNYWSDHKVQGNPGDAPVQIMSKGVDRYPFRDPGGWR
jgi:parallel beta-helix repeat protein